MEVKNGKRSMLELDESIFSELLKSNKPITITHLQERIGTGFDTIKRHIEAIRYIQDMPKIDIVAESKRAKFIYIKRGVTRDDIEFIKEIFPEISAEQRILMKLVDMKDIPLSSFNKEDQDIIKTLAKKRRVIIKNNKVNITKLGKTIGRGAQIVYGRS